MLWEYLQETFAALRTKARYRRVIHEQMLALAERSRPGDLDEQGWQMVGASSIWGAAAGLGATAFDATAQHDLRTEVRHLVRTNPHAANALRLLDNYVTGPGFKATAASQPTNGNVPVGAETLATLDRIWNTFLEQSRRHFTLGEFARRAWRDGEVFLRRYEPADIVSGPHSQTLRTPTTSIQIQVRFIDPEAIATPTGYPDTNGLVVDPHDPERVLGYQLIDVASGELLEVIPAEEMLHVRMNVDSSESRGVSLFAPVVRYMKQFDKWLHIELEARRLQASIVLWRRMQGPMPAGLSGVTDSQTGLPRERFSPGSIVSTSQGTELKFLSPDTNFGDAVPLGRLLLLCVAAGVGLPEFMLSSDASNGNFASTMVAEGPAVKLFESQQRFFADHLAALWYWVMNSAEDAGRLPAGMMQQVSPVWSFPALVNRDRPRERGADVALIRAGVLSQSEVARRDNVDPVVMQRERAEEAVHGTAGTSPLQQL